LCFVVKLDGGLLEDGFEVRDRLEDMVCEDVALGCASAGRHEALLAAIGAPTRGDVLAHRGQD
jgi:hypothetical protein